METLGYDGLPGACLNVRVFECGVKCVLEKLGAVSKRVTSRKLGLLSLQQCAFLSGQGNAR